MHGITHGAEKFAYRAAVLTVVEIRQDVWGRYPAVIFTLHLQRKPLYYIVNLIVPCCLFSVLALSTFLLQPNSSDRLQIGTCVFLTTDRSNSMKGHRGDPDPYHTHGYFGPPHPTRQTASRSVYPFCGIHSRDVQTTPHISSNRPHLCCAYDAA